MCERQIAIADMQCWIFRMAQTKWNVTQTECAHIFKQYDVLEYIEQCFGILHLSGYDYVLDDIEEMLHNKGWSHAAT